MNMDDLIHFYRLVKQEKILFPLFEKIIDLYTETFTSRPSPIGYL